MKTTLFSFLQSLLYEKLMVDCFTSRKISFKKQTWWSNDKTIYYIIELRYHKISWFVNVSQVNYLPNIIDDELLLNFGAKFQR